MNKTIAAAVWQRAQGVCEYCRLPDGIDGYRHEVDHVIARQHGGKTRMGNLALSCEHCNGHKGPNLSGLDPLSGKLTPLFHPRRHKWKRHFAWDGSFIRGLTKIGRVTVIVLNLNDPIRVLLRMSLEQEGVSFE